MIAYGLLVQQAHSLIKERLQQEGYENPIIAQPRVFLDGITVERIELEKGKEISNLFIQANPIQIVMRQPRFLSVKKIDLSFDKPFQRKISFISDTAFQVDKAILRFPNYQNLIVEMVPKQVSATTALINVTGKGSDIFFEGKGDIRFEGNTLQTINIDFSTIDIDQKRIRTKRTDGWISFSYKDQWMVNGEAGAGFADINALSLADAVFTVNGSVSSYSWILNGKERKTRKTVSIEGNANKMHALVEKKELDFEHASFDNFKKLAAVVPLEKEKKKEDSEKIVKSPEKKQKIKQKIEQKPIIVPLVKKSFHALVFGSFFEGFHYTQKMTTIDVPCSTHSLENCWAARARGGMFGFENYAIPSYLTRLQDYEQARLLSNVLKSLQIKTLALQGIGKHVQKMTINGMTADHQPVYIELSVSDVN